MANTAGSTQVTGDGSVGTSGNPIRVFTAHLISGGSAGSLVLRNGTDATGAEYIRETGVVSEGQTFIYGEHGILFPNGCFYDHNANNTSVLIAYAQDR